MPWGPPSACTTWWLILLLTFSTTTPKLLVIPAVPGIDGDDLHVVSVENTTVVVYTPASIQLSPGTTFAPLGSFVSIAHPARKEDLLTAALDAAAAPPRLVSNTSEDDLRHPVAFDLLFVHPASQLHIWRPQPLEDRWFPMGDVVTMGSSAPDPMRVWLIASQCLGEFAGYAPLALDAHQTTCTTVTIGDMGVLEARGMTMVRACEAHGNQLGALGTVWLGKREPCGHVVPVFCPMPSCMAVPGRSSWGDTSVDRWCIHGVHRFVRLCQPLVEGTHAALAAAGGSLTQGTLGTLNVKQGGMVLRRELSNRLRGCFMVAHQLFSVRYRKRCADLQSVKDYLNTRFQSTFELELVLNMTEVASNAQLLRWPLNQEYLNPPLATHTEELPDEAGAGGGQGNDGQGRGGEDDDDDPATVEAQAAKEKTA